MRYATFFACIAAALGANASTRAQEAPPTPASAAWLTPELLRVPLSEGPRASDEQDEKLYAARESFKVVVDEGGFEVHPFLGDAAPQSLPLAWRTRSIAIGALELPLASKPTVEHGAWECTLQHADFRERYEIADAGLELSWTFSSLPLDAGDLLIEGEVRTALRANACEPRHGGLVFADANGEAVLSFGAAIAFDAAGRSCTVRTRFDGESRIVLALESAWLREATLPVTVDPLIGPTSITVSGAGGGLASIETGLQTDTATRNVLVAFTRAFSAADHDVYAALMNDDFGSPVRVYSDLSPSNSDRDVSVAYVGGAYRWVIAHQRDFANAAGLYSGIRMHFRDHDELSENTGVSLTHWGGLTESLTRPDLGGCVRGGSVSRRGMLVYQRDLTTTRANTPNSEVLAVTFDAVTASLGNSFLPGGTPVGSNLDREDPCASPRAGMFEPACAIAWSEWNHLVTVEDWDLQFAMTSFTGDVHIRGLLADGVTRHLRRPKIAGDGGDYLVTFEVSASLALQATVEIRARTLHWFFAPPTVGPIRTIAGPVWSGQPLVNGDLTASSFTTHWIAVYAQTQSSSPTERRTAHAVRLGGTGVAIESATLFDDAASSAAIPAATFHDQDSVALCIAGSANVSTALLGYRFGFHPGAGWLQVGANCGNAFIAASRPFAGHTEFTTSIYSAPASSSAVLLISLASVNIPLDGVGLTGCSLYAAPGGALLAAFSASVSSGSASMRLPLPDVPLFQGDFVLQWIYTNPGANPIGVQTTAGLVVHVR